MLSPATIRRLLPIADVQRDPYAVAQAAAALLGDHATSDTLDPLAAGAYLRALAALGLGAAAEHFASAFPGCPPIAAVRAELTTLPPGTVPWTSRRRRFEANLRALATRWPHAADAIAAAWPHAATRYQLHQCADGNPQVYDLQSTRPPQHRWLASLDNHKAATALWTFDRRDNPRPAPILFDGIGLGWMLPHVAATTENSFLGYSCALYVVEPDPVALAIALHLHDLQPLLASTRLRLFTGPTAADDLSAALRANPAWPIPQMFIANLLTPRQPIPAQDLTDAVAADRTTRRREAKARVDAHYAAITLAQWHQRFADAAAGKGPPLRVLGLTSRFSTVVKYAMAELEAAVHASGHTMRVLMEDDDHTAEIDFVGTIEDFKPDLLVMISRMRYENPDLPAAVPFLCWDQDNLPCMRSPAATASINPLTYVAGHGAVYGQTHLGWPAENCVFCHGAAATHRYAPRQLPADTLADLACDFSYVSNAAGTPDALRDQLIRPFPEHPRHILTAMLEAIPAGSPDNLPWHELTLRNLQADICQRENLPLSPAAAGEVHMAATTFSDRFFRHQTLAWVSQYCRQNGRTLRIYGSGWEAHPALAQHAAGMAQQGDHLAAICQATRINLQIIETGILHPRFLDGVAAGGFFLLRKTHNEHTDAAFVAARNTAARYLQQHPVDQLEDLAHAPDPAVRGAWRIIAPQYLALRARTGLSERVMLASLRTSTDRPHPHELFPDLDAIAFTTPESFACLADTYLGDDAARTALAGRLRQSVLTHFSHDARWRQFLTRVTQGLGHYAHPQ